MASADGVLPLAVTETIDAVVTPSVRDAVLQEALDEVGDRLCVGDAEALYEFVVGPLRASLVRALGNDLGVSLTEELERVVTTLPPSSFQGLDEPRTGRRVRRSVSPAPRRSVTPRPGAVRPRFAPTPPPITAWPSPESKAQSQRPSSKRTQPSPGMRVVETRVQRTSVDPRREEDRPTIPSPPPRRPRAGTLESTNPPLVPPPSSAQLPRGTATALGVLGTSERTDARLPRVLVATKDGALARRLSAWLDPRASVRRVRSAALLIREIADAGDVPCVVVLDCRQPTIRPIALAALAEDLPLATRVIVWGESEELRSELCLISGHAEAWFFTSADTRAKAIADQCAELVS